jgi:sulfur relay (sulfurtransferase) DsrF/TusC family protein
MKTTTVVISQSPLKMVRVAEALRMSVGLTLCDDAVRVVFVGDGVYTLLHTEPARVGMPEYSRHVRTLKDLGHEIYAERESLEERGLEKISFKPRIVSRSEVARLLLDSDAVIRY